MSPDTTNTDPVVLLVSDLNDADIRRCVDRLIAAGIPVERSQSVYAATADLALGRSIRHVLLDIRSLDDKEMAFHRLVRRSYPDTSVAVPVFRGTGERAATYGPGVRPVPLDSLLVEMREEFAKPAAAEETSYGDAATQPHAAPFSTEQPTTPATPDVAHAAEPTDSPLPLPTADEDAEIASSELDKAVFDADEDAEDWEASLATHPDDDLDAETEHASPIESDPPASEVEWLAPAEATSAESPPPQAETPANDISTNEGPDAYRTVRDKLAGELRSAARRTPPRRPPGTETHEPHSADQPSPRPASMLSPEEMDALMKNDKDEQSGHHEEGEGA